MAEGRISILRLILISQALHLLIPVVVQRFGSKHSNEQALHGHSWLLNFDGIHYFFNQYSFEQNHAFLPFFVTAINIAKDIIGKDIALILFVVLNRILFALTAYEIQRILTLICEGKDKRMVEIGTIAFLFNPASIFYHTLYTESIFCFVTFKGIRMTLEGKNVWFSAILFSFGVALRSNGMFLAPVIGLQIISKFIDNTRRMQASVSFKYLMKGSAMLLIILTPFIFHLIFSYVNICVKGNAPPLVCNHPLPNLYTYVQEKYWNVGFFNYFRQQNTIFILIGSPAILLSLLGIANTYNGKWDIKVKGLYLSFVILALTTISFTNIQSSTRFFSTNPYFYYIIGKYGQRWKIVRFWSIFYCLAGIYLYILAFPWT